MLRLTDLMMHATLSLGVPTLTPQGIVRANMRLDAIMSIQESNERKIHKSSQLKEAHASLYTADGIQMGRVVGSTVSSSSSKKNDDDDEDDDQKGDKYVARCSVIGEQIATDNHHAITPRISFQHPQNAICWSYTRLIVQNFGERFRCRLDTYVAFFLVLLVILTTFALGSVFTSTNRQRTFQSTFFLQSFLALTVGVVFMLLFSWSASLVNSELELHSRTLSAHSLKFNYKIQQDQGDPESKRTESELETLRRVAESIDAAMGIADVNTTLKPFKILGMTAQPALTMSIATAALSFYGIVGSMYFGTQTIEGQIFSNV
eukprot:gene35149-43333_t